MNWYIGVLKNYAGFSGRARRQEFWMFVLFNVIVAVLLSVIDAVAGLGFLSLLYALAVIVPSLAVSVRRLHDTGKPWFWILIGLIPIVGGLILIYFYVLDSAPGDNEFGPNPKGA